MPAKNSQLTYGNRDHIINNDLYKKYKAATGSKIDFKTFKSVIVQSNKEISKIVCGEPEGFKMPENLGYLVVTKFKTKKRPIDYLKSKLYDTKVIHNNLHSDGAMYSLRWFNTRISNNHYTKIYKYIGNRVFKREVAKSIKNEVQFLSWNNSDFFNYNKVTKLYNTINRKNGSN